MEAADRIREPTTDGSPIEPLLSIADVRHVLRISESSVYRLMRSGELPAIRIGGRTLFAPDAVRALIAARSNSVTPMSNALEGS